MDLYRLPGFEPVTREELRRLWVQYPQDDIRRLLLEVERYRRVIKVIDEHYLSIHQSWRNALGGDLTALHMLKQIMHSERYRTPE